MFCFVLDTSPLSSSPLNAQTPWHGNVETSTDTLVPVDDKISNSEISTTTLATKSIESNAAHENGIELTGDSSRSSNYHYQLSDISSIKSKPLPNCGIQNIMDESILIQPEQQRMEIHNGYGNVNGNRSEAASQFSTYNHNNSTAIVPNGTANNVSSSLYRRRRNSFNSKPPPYIGDMSAAATANNTTIHTRSDSISPNTMNSKFFLQNTTRSLQSTQSVSSTIMRTLHSTQSHAPANLSSISCPDGLAHALSEQNLRLQQIVHEHKVSVPSNCHDIKSINILYENFR